MLVLQHKKLNREISPVDWLDKFIGLEVFTLSSLTMNCWKFLFFFVHPWSEDCFEKPSALQGFQEDFPYLLTIISTTRVSFLFKNLLSRRFDPSVNSLNCI